MGLILEKVTQSKLKNKLMIDHFVMVGGHHIWTPGMELRVAQDFVDYVDNDQTQPARSAGPGIGAPELEHAEQSDHSQDLVSALFLIEIICQHRHQVPDK